MQNGGSDKSCKKSNRLKGKHIWLSVLVIIICIAASTVVLANKIGSYLLNDTVRSH